MAGILNIDLDALFSSVRISNWPVFEQIVFVYHYLRTLPQKSWWFALGAAAVEAAVLRLTTGALLPHSAFSVPEPRCVPWHEI